MNKKWFLLSGYLMIVALSAFVFSGCNKSSSTPPREKTEEEKRAEEGFKALDAKKSEYVKIPAKEQLSKEPYIKKKMIFYRFDSYKKGTEAEWQKNDFGTDKFGSSLPSEAYNKVAPSLAKNPEEVGLIAVMPECKEVSAGQYGSTAAFQEQCELMLIDPELQAVVYRTLFKGVVDSSKYIGKETSVTARVDGMEVVDFLASLKAKPDSAPSKNTKK